MAIMLGASYQALLEAHAGEESARRAAEEVAGYDKAIADLRTDIKVIQALVSMVLLLLIGVLWQGFTIMGRLPR
jgi:hypothetical protein